MTNRPHIAPCDLAGLNSKGSTGYCPGPTEAGTTHISNVYLWLTCSFFYCHYTAEAPEGCPSGQVKHLWLAVMHRPACCCGFDPSFVTACPLKPRASSALAQASASRKPAAWCQNVFFRPLIVGSSFKVFGYSTANSQIVIIICHLLLSEPCLWFQRFERLLKRILTQIWSRRSSDQDHHDVLCNILQIELLFLLSTYVLNQS